MAAFERLNSHVKTGWPGAYVFVAKAIEAARDLPALAALRMTLRPHLRSLTDGVRGADIGVPLRALWRRWCEGRSPVATTIAC